MKRSEINQLIRRSEAFFDSMQFKLPAWASWTPEQWKGKADVASEIVEAMLGWDLTDFGSADFASRGLILFTIRNGILGKNAKPYAEKVMIVGENQETPMHFHWHKMEDIINRGGGNLAMQLYGAAPDESLAGTPLQVSVDGIARTVNAGETVILAPGESICLEPRVYHRFYGEPGKGPVLVGEVSMVNDDNTDNRFLDPLGRFPAIDEDEPPYRLLVNDYGSYL